MYSQVYLRNEVQKHKLKVVKGFIHDHMSTWQAASAALIISE